MPSIDRSTPIHIAMRDAMLREAADISRDANLPAAQAQVLFTVVAWGRMGDDGWCCDTTRAALCATLGCNEHRIRRASQGLARAGLLTYTPGDGPCSSHYLVAWLPVGFGRFTGVGSAGATGRGSAGATGRGSAGATGGVAPALPLLPSEFRRAQASAGTVRQLPIGGGQGRAVAGGSSGRQKTPAESRCRAMLERAPSWWPRDKPWIDPEVADQLAAASTTTVDVISVALDDTRRRVGLRNPAGWLVGKIRQPDMTSVYREAEARRRREERAAQAPPEAPRSAEARPPAEVEPDYQAELRQCPDLASRIPEFVAAQSPFWQRFLARKSPEEIIHGAHVVGLWRWCKQQGLIP